MREWRRVQRDELDPSRPGAAAQIRGAVTGSTLTLPEWVVSALASVHKDISKAVVQLTERRRPKDRHPLAELAVIGRSAVITVRPTPSLERRADISSHRCQTAGR